MTGGIDDFENEDRNDIFKYVKQDEYFGDGDDGQSWNTTPLDWNMKRGFQQGLQRPSISLNGASYEPPPFYVF